MKNPKLLQKIVAGVAGQVNKMILPFIGNLLKPCKVSTTWTAMLCCSTGSYMANHRGILLTKEPTAAY
jgi:hypothetical protein